MPSNSGLSTQAGHEAALHAKHAAIAAQIEEKQKSKTADEIEIRALKKMKLKLKEQLEGIRSTSKGAKEVN